jgi:hypothetical protein
MLAFMLCLHHRIHDQSYAVEEFKRKIAVLETLLKEEMQSDDVDHPLNKAGLGTVNTSVGTGMKALVKAAAPVDDVDDVPFTTQDSSTSRLNESSRLGSLGEEDPQGEEKDEID